MTYRKILKYLFVVCLLATAFFSLIPLQDSVDAGCSGTMRCRRTVTQCTDGEGGLCLPNTIGCSCDDVDQQQDFSCQGTGQSACESDGCDVRGYTSNNGGIRLCVWSTPYAQSSYYAQSTYYSQGYYQTSYYAQSSYTPSYSQSYYQNSYTPSYGESSYTPTYGQSSYYSESGYLGGGYAQSTYATDQYCPNEGQDLGSFCQQFAASCPINTIVDQKAISDPNAPGYCGVQYICTGTSCGPVYSQSTYQPNYSESSYGGCQSTASLNCSGWSAATIDPNTGNTVSVTGVQGTNISASHTLTVNPGQLITFSAAPAPSGDYGSGIVVGGCAWGLRMEMDIINTATGNTALKCYENRDTSNNVAYFCNNGAPYAAYNSDPLANSGFPGIPATTKVQSQEGCGYIGPDGDADGGNKFACGQCQPNGTAHYCSGGSHTFTTNGNDTYIHGGSCSAPDGSDTSTDYDSNDCKVSGLDNYSPGLHTYNEYADGIAKKTFQNPGTYRVEYHGVKVGAGYTNACSVNVVVKNPTPTTPTGDINAASPTCDIPAGQTKCNIRLDWRASNADTIYINYRQGGRDFLTDTSTLSGNGDAAVTNQTYTFDLYGRNGSDPWTLLDSVNIAGVSHQPAGTITATPTSCIMQEGQITCPSTIKWSSTYADTIRIIKGEDGSTFQAETTTTSNPTGKTADTTAGSNTYTLYGKNSFYPSYAVIETVTVNTNPYIYGYVYIDTDEDGSQDPGEPAWTSGGSVSINGTPNNLDPDGHYVRLNLAPNANPGAYTVSFTPPTGYESTYPTGGTNSFSLSGPIRQDFGIAPLHTISGRVFNDQNKNKIFDTGDSGYGGLMTIEARQTDGTLISSTMSDGSGNYTLSNLPSQLTNVELTSSIPSGYKVIWPVNTTPPTYTVKVGPTCTSGPLDTTTGASYINTGACNIQELDFPISNSIPWLQLLGSDGRFDTGINNGQFTNFVANNLACGSGYTLIPGANTVSGVIAIGPGDKGTAFGGVGKASANNWVLGAPFPEYFTTFGSNPDASGQGLQTSYDYISGTATTSSITPKDMTTISGCSDLTTCSIGAGTPSGIYRANGDVTLTSATFPSAPNGKNYIFLINGNLTINGKITTPVGSTATFAVKGNITIDKSVGTGTLACPTTATDSQIQGFFSADKSIIIESKDPTGAGNNCSDGQGADLELNIDGVLVANASLTNGGFFNKRDLCALNITYPSISVKERLDFVLNAPELLKTQSSIYREINP
jgi:hypothetical protein